ncbi:uncharacterized protein [Coffea arabica]|uniref:Reverse transcriptase domain-containing protein n=1 Tax=Coffea arabica TaxID=13443 RepID=A0ABM4VQF3_COFAR
MNRELAELYDVSKVLHLARGRSDHAPLLIKCGSGRQRASAFRYLNVWPRNASFHGVVERAWVAGTPARTMSEFYRKLVAVQDKLRARNKEVFGHIGARVADLEKVMCTAELRYDMERTVPAKISYHEARAAYMKQMAIECEFWHQKSRIKRIQDGDANTTFFYAAVRQRRSSNYIARIHSATGQWLTSPADIKCSAASFFETLFTSDRDTDRHPACWGLLKDELVVATQDYFKDGWLPKGSGFSRGHQIIDNILLAQEHVQELDHRLESSNLMLKLDEEKAYDRVEWSFLLFMVRAFGFQEEAVDLIFRLVANNWFSVLVNGEPAGFLKSTHGVRQGGPISPALFVLVAEFFGRGIHTLFQQGRHIFFQPGGLKVLYLAFTDDVIVFTRLSRESLEAIGDFFRQYQKYSGQKINAAKSCFVCPSGATQAQVLDTWCELGPLHTLLPASKDMPHFLVAEFLRRDGWNRDRLLR